MNDQLHGHGLSSHRIEALTDGIYAVAMTLLVIELKLPPGLHASDQLGDALIELAPRFYAWLLSFFVLAIFWLGHHRAFASVRHADGPLIALNIAQLACVSLMPFSCAVLGEHGTLLAQIVYSGNMILLAVFSLLTLTHIHAHPALSVAPPPRSRFEAARFRILGLIVISTAAVLLQAALPTWPGVGNSAFALMAVIVPWSRRIERRGPVAAPADAATGHVGLAIDRAPPPSG